MFNRLQRVWRMLALTLGAALLLTGCGHEQSSALLPAGPVAESQLWLIKLSLSVMVTVIVVVAIIFVYVLFRFRARKGQTGIPKQVEGNTALEIIWTVVPILLLFILAIPTVTTTFSLAEDFTQSEDAVQVKVTAHQFWWEFEYPNLGIVTAQDLYIPTGQTISFELTSKDVIHSFWVPALGGKMDTNPGNNNMVNKMWLQADKEGVFLGKCAELCGASHALMDFKVVAVSPEEFDAWVNKMKEGPAAAEGVALEGEKVFQQSCIGCHAVDAGMRSIGPNLTSFGDRLTLAGVLTMDDNETLKQWILNSESFKEESKMPSFEGQLSDEQLDALVEYLRGLKLQ